MSNRSSLLHYTPPDAALLIGRRVLARCRFPPPSSTWELPSLPLLQSIVALPDEQPLPPVPLHASRRHALDWSTGSRPLPIPAGLLLYSGISFPFCFFNRLLRSLMSNRPSLFRFTPPDTTLLIGRRAIARSRSPLLSSSTWEFPSLPLAQLIIALPDEQPFLPTPLHASRRHALDWLSSSRPLPVSAGLLLYSGIPFPSAPATDCCTP